MKKSISVACVLSAQCAFGGTLVVLNKSEATASLVNLNSLKVVATVKTGIGPHEVAISNDGKTAVVANYGDNSEGNTLTLIDLHAARVVGEISLGAYTRPHGISFTENSNELVVTAEEQKAILKVDLLLKKVTQVIKTDQSISHMLSVDTTNKRVFVSNIGAKVISVLDLIENKKIIDIETDKGPEGIDYNSYNNEIWVANRSANNLTVIDSASLKVKTKINTGEFPIRVKFTPDNKYVLVTNAQSGSLDIFNSITKEKIKTVQFPKSNMDTAGKMFGDKFKMSSVPIGIAFDPQNQRAFIAHASLDQISVFDLKKLELVDSFKAGREPDGMAYSKITMQDKQKGLSQ
ncbi:MAG: YncE family protein [Bdellovibrionaceae bacterium]|nr:YncE family protein [Pseudobdellovibrionaceae bacterium]